jgi:cell division protein FtsL
LQEKAADRQADIDALRAKRSFEQGERDARKREVLENEKRRRLLAEMEVAREVQFKERESNL